MCVYTRHTSTCFILMNTETLQQMGSYLGAQASRASTFPVLGLQACMAKPASNHSLPGSWYTSGCLGLWEPHGCSSGFPRVVPSSPPPCGDAGVQKPSSLPKWPQSGSLDPAHCIKVGALNPCVTSTRGVPLIRCLGRRLGRDSWKGDLGLGPNSSCVVVGVFSKWRSQVGSPAVHHLTRCSRQSL